MKILLVSVLLALFSFQSPAQNQAIDSLTSRLKSAVAESPGRVDLLNQLSLLYQGVDFSKAAGFAEQADTLARKIGYPKGLAVANNRKALCNIMMGNSEVSIDQALFSVNIAEAEGLIEVLAESYRLLGVSYTEIDRPKAESNLRKSVALALRIDDKITLTKAYTSLGVLKSYGMTYDSATVLFDKALALAAEVNFDFYVPIINANKVTAISRAGKTSPKEIYEKCVEVIDLANAGGNRFALCLGYLRLAEYHHKHKQYAKSNEFHQKSIAIAEEMKLRAMLKGNYFSMIALKVEEGDFWGAHGYMKKYYDLKEQLMNEKKSWQIVEMETRYETEKKEATIQLLEREKQIQNIWKYVWISGSIFVVVVTLIIYRLQVQKNKKSEQLLEAQRELNIKLKETDQLKSRFFANLSHEFRTPLSLIIAPLEEQILNSRGARADLDSMRLIKRNANRLLDMVNDLLDLSKLEVKKMKLSVRRGDLQKLLSILVSSFESLADHKNIRIIKNFSLPANESWYDSDKIEKVINNLLSNAYKFTPGGGTVTLDASTTRDNSFVMISVSDTGPGIPIEDQPYLFSPFFQSSSKREIDGRGTGLGLALVKELIELHKGVVSVRSSESGTNFTVSFPISSGSFEENEIATVEAGTPVRGTSVLDQEVEREPVVSYNNQRMLIVEDNSDLATFISSIFRADYSITTARNGREGLQRAIEKQPDIIISDVMMPEVDGFTMLTKLREDERINHIPVVMLTARNEAESRLKGFRFGVDDYLAKPFSTEELRARVGNLVEQRKLLAVRYRERFVTAATSVTVESVDEVFIKKVVTAIEEHLSDASFSVEKLAEQMSLSRTQLFRKLKALMNVSPNQLINDIRLQRASELILSKADTISQICYRVGFNEPSYFARRFRQKYGVTPGEFADRG
jgi:signal transduction histidine kinase/DNA-binding response OmpR family regulator